MVKAKFGARVRFKTTAAQLNEVLYKLLCHNLCCLVESRYELPAIFHRRAGMRLTRLRQFRLDSVKRAGAIARSR